MKANIVFKSLIQDIKDIEKRNKVFNSLSAEGKRLEIAWDCLQLLLKEKVVGYTGGYWSNEIFNATENCKNSKEFQKTLVKNLPNCEVCARGGMMLSQIRLGNKVSPNDNSCYHGNYHNIRGFNMKVFEQMENEYERCSYEHPYKWNTTEKLANICCNILVNGNFNVKDKTDYLYHEKIN